MFENLKAKWKVNGKDLFLILCVFAITGTTTAYISKEITQWFSIEKYSLAFWLVKILILIFGYQVLILLISIPFGQFYFFWNYEKKILRRMGLLKKENNN
jgi:hypothetical protein